jgi:hypothetical protein
VDDVLPGTYQSVRHCHFWENRTYQWVCLGAYRVVLIEKTCNSDRLDVRRRQTFWRGLATARRMVPSDCSKTHQRLNDKPGIAPRHPHLILGMLLVYRIYLMRSVIPGDGGNGTPCFGEIAVN